MDLSLPRARRRALRSRPAPASLETEISQQRCRELFGRNSQLHRDGREKDRAAATASKA
jgi:hypothetical protein